MPIKSRSTTPSASPREVLVGRRRELSQLRRAVEDIRQGRGGILLIAGEPGIGKTRLAREAATVAATRKVQVL
jgi:predicted ATPase